MTERAAGRARVPRCRPTGSASAKPSWRCTSATRRTSKVMPESCASRPATAEVQACMRIAVRHGRPFVARGAGTGLAGGATPLDDAIMIVDHEDEPGAVGRPGQPAGVGRAGRAQPRPDPGGHAARPALRPRPQQPAELLDRRQRRQQLRWSALPGRWRDHVAHARPRGRPARRRDRELGGEEAGARTGYDLRGAFVGSEGMCGIATQGVRASDARIRRPSARC